MPLTQRIPVDDASPEFCAGRKVPATHQALLWPLLNDDPHCPSRMVLHAIAESQVQISVTLRHINRLRKAWGLNRAKGRPRRAGSPKTICVSGASRPGYAFSVVCWRPLLRSGDATTRECAWGQALAAASDSSRSHAASGGGLSPLPS